jgi:hypothetical protein
MRAKKFKRCTKGDTIFIYDFNDISKGFQEFKIIDVEHIPEEIECCGCGGCEPEHWYLHFDSPYLDRTISVNNNTEDFIIYRGKYAFNDHGKMVVKDIELGLFTEIKNAKQKISKHYIDIIDEYNRQMKNLDKQIEYINEKKINLKNDIAKANDALIEFETNVNEKI